MPCGCTQVLEPDPTGEFSICDNAGSLAFTEHGVTALVQGSASLMVTFTGTKASDAYSFTELAIENTTDANPFALIPEVTSRTNTGFTVSINGIPDTANYRLRWNVYITNL